MKENNQSGNSSKVELALDKKILVFSLAFRPYIGGAEVAIEEITKRLNDDFGFDLITARFNKDNLKEEVMDGVRIYRVGFGCFFDKYLFPFLAFLKAKELHSLSNYSVVWAVLETYAGLSALFFKWRFKIKYLLTMQSGDSDNFIKIRTWFWLPLYKQVFRQADIIQVISQWLKERAIKYGYRGLIEIIPNGVDVEKFSRKLDEEEKLCLQRQLSLKSDDKIIITVSRLVEKNGIGDLIESIKYLPGDYKLLIIGEGKLEKDLKQKTKDLNLNDRVIFLGKVNHEVIAEFLKISQVFVRPSLSEGFGNVFVEAMAAGVPIIATSVGGIKDFLIDGKTGLVCLTQNPQSIAEQVIRLFETPNLRESLIKNGLNLSKKDYDWQIIAGRMKIIFENLCAS